MARSQWNSGASQGSDGSMPICTFQLWCWCCFVRCVALGILAAARLESVFGIVSWFLVAFPRHSWSKTKANSRYHPILHVAWDCRLWENLQCHLAPAPSPCVCTLQSSAHFLRDNQTLLCRLSPEPANLADNEFSRSIPCHYRAIWRRPAAFAESLAGQSQDFWAAEALKTCLSSPRV